MTKKLYDTDSKLFSFSATVLSCEEGKDGFSVLLNETAFFPEGGGQKSDRGTLNGIPVTDVQERKGEIFHILRAPLPVGAQVQGVVDARRRKRMMEHHSGEHLLSGLLKSQYGFENVGFHLSDDTVTLDTSGYLDEAQCEQLERDANRVVRENRKIKVLFPSPEEARSLDYRSKLEITEGLRLVEIEGVDLCACCAPHVEYTGEIGLIRIAEHIRYKGGTRLTILCGADAVAACQREKKVLLEIARSFSVKPEEAWEAVKKAAEETQGLRESIKELNQEKMDNLVASAGDAPFLCLVVKGLSPQEKITLCDRLSADKSGLCAVLEGDDERGYSGVIGCAAGGMKARIKEINTRLSGKGGGSDLMYHGSLQATKEKILEFLQNS